MNISEVKVALTGSDLLSMLDEFVKVDGLTISDIILNEEIRIYGSFKKGIKIDFIAGIKIGRVEDGKIYAQVSSFKVLKIGIISILRKLAMKYAVKSFEEKGIYYGDGKVIINIKKILKDIPYVDFDIEDIHMNKSVINLAVKNINLSIAGTLIKEVEEDELSKEEDECTDISTINKVKDNYSIGRDYVENKLSEKAKKLSDYIFVIPDMVALIYRLLKDKRVPMRTKMIISAAVAYIACSRDIIPDKIPFIGKIDEISVAFFALDRIVSDIPVYIILENWEGKNDIILVIKSIIEYVTNFTNAKNVEKLYSFINEVISL